MEPGEEVLFGWGLSTHARSRVYRPSSFGEARRSVRDARGRGLPVGHRGAGQSYGDAALLQGGALLVTDRLDGIRRFDAEEGTVRAEAGVTIDQLWRAAIGDGWWPPVVPGTGRPTLGGCAAANVHGKNHWQAGAFGDHVRAVTVMDAGGEVRRLERSEDPEAVDRHLGALGLTGTILAVTLEMKRVESGYLQVQGRTTRDLAETLDLLEIFSEQRDHAVAWVDCFARGRELGRAEVHAASDLPAGHPSTGRGLDEESQGPGPNLVEHLPGGMLRRGLGIALSDPGMRAVNAAKYRTASLRHPSTYVQSRAGFHFLLDSVPEWRRAYEPGGLAQYQLFLPEEEARAGFRRAVELQHQIGVRSYLGVMKRHRKQPQADTYSLDGYSLALDFPVREGNLPALMELTAEYDRLQRRAGGRVYGAKDAVSRMGDLPEFREAPYASNLSRRWKRGG